MDPDVKTALDALERAGRARVRDGMARYGIVAPRAFGVPVGKIQQIAKRLGPHQALAVGLWRSGWYEARMLACFVAEPTRMTPALMDRWCRDFDNWAICDTACMHLFDRTPHAFAKVRQWAKRRGELERRAAFALLASLAVHHKKETDEPFLKCLPLIEAAAGDERNFVKKAVSWALRAVGRRNARIHAKSVALARRLADSPEASARWAGKDALRDLTRPLVTRRFAAGG
jgi:3-methyladenine DNA glycosylase AlkD